MQESCVTYFYHILNYYFAPKCPKPNPKHILSSIVLRLDIFCSKSRFYFEFFFFIFCYSYRHSL